MIKGTTPTHIFNIPFDTSLISEVKITYSQDDSVVLSKSTKDCVINDSTIKITLGQSETFLFDHNKCVDVQLRILTTGGDALASIPQRIGVSRCLDNEVLV